MAEVSKAGQILKSRFAGSRVLKVRMRALSRFRRGGAAETLPAIDTAPDPTTLRGNGKTSGRSRHSLARRPAQ